ncbi:cyanophycin synthetase [Sphingopyxis sp. JAI108]|uniref:cyanophycin synthetase n=1 Tax=Sphingopyxis sp. JAI108 TaxID=2723060 RepID=UPI0017EC13D2|nr:cyanophycin synthetase [Sphingopyxis sp. JAI108]NYF33642.1 cyanophycin synthetase [Sphingopyxis sp. JAI108]
MTSASLRVLERSVYAGPHLYGRRPMIRIRVDLGMLDRYPSDRLPGFAEALQTLLPGLADHGCSYSEAGGFLRRLAEGTWLGHIIEHVAIELQTWAGAAITRGKTRRVRGKPGQYDILYCYADQTSGLAAGRAAIELVDALLPSALQGAAGLDRIAPALDGSPTDIATRLSALRTLVRKNRLGPSTAALVAEARRRHIPVFRLDKASLIQFGTGHRQRRIRASVTGATSLIGAELAANKQAAKEMLASIGIPVPPGEVVRTISEAERAAAKLGWPVVVKPLDGNQGRGVTTGVADGAALRDAFVRAQAIAPRVIVERQLNGADHRILVVGNDVVAVAERIAAHVIGDGTTSIAALIEAVNDDPRRGAGHEAVLTRIRVDAALEAFLAEANHTLASVPAAGETVMLRGAANLSTGGSAIDRTDAIHPDNAAIAIDAAAALGLDVAGIDMIVPDIARSVRATGGGIVEVNAAPGLRMHLAPSEGTARDVARPIIASLFPKGRKSRIPVFAITGTNGKTTTVRMLARILERHGLTTGFTCTSGVYVGETRSAAGDASGPKSARMLLRHPRVEAAVLETARGGMLREGLAFDACDVGAVLNVTPDHLGLKGIDTLADLARVKAIVARNVKKSGACVLNAADPLTVRMARRARGRIVWFTGGAAADALAPIEAHRANSGLAVSCERGTLMLHRGGETLPIISVAAIPATLKGAALFNVENAAAAAAMAAAYGIAPATIAAGLASFRPSFEDSPGRLSLSEAHGVRIVVDYAHNRAALNALADLLASMRGETGARVIGMIGIPGDRRDCDLVEIGALSGGMFDVLMLRENVDLRGRPPGEANALMRQGALEAGLDADAIGLHDGEYDAASACLAAARPGDIVVLTPTDVDGIWRLVEAWAAGPGPQDARLRQAAHG